MVRSIAALILCLSTFASQAALLGRAPATVNGTDYRAFYDDVLNITWLADADYAKTSGYDADGLMTWSASVGWIATLNAANHLGTNNWRLPFVVDTGAPGCDSGNDGTDCGIYVQTKIGAAVYSEMAHVHYDTLGNAGSNNAGGQPTPECSNGNAPYCLTNTGPFSNLQPADYWSGTPYLLSGDRTWRFGFSDGAQFYDFNYVEFHAWAVTDGDALAVVPVPAAAWLFGSALGLIGLIRRKVIE